MKQFVLGDIHGAYRALMQCFERASFDYKKDKLVFMGDICDGWSETKACIDELLKVKNLIYILGNHDTWALEWGWNGSKPDEWLAQGGLTTIESYDGKMPRIHIDFLLNAKMYQIKNNRLFIHAGFIPELDLEKQDKEIFLWDRRFVEYAVESSKNNKDIRFTEYDEVYVGHTPTIRYGSEIPMKCGELWLMDTGAGWNGKLTIMNLDTKEFFQSDRVTELYPHENGRY